MANNLTEEHQKADQERTKATELILSHKGSKKVVVAGPGTGKTHLFKQIFATKAGGKNLTLTFINALVEDLSLELHGISEVRTLHGFALSVLKGDIKLYPFLPRIVQEDGEILLGSKIDFLQEIHDAQLESKNLLFYKTRRKYYECFGYSDIILELIEYLSANPDKIPTYSQVVVDEFQDFNKLEVTLIEQLSQKSPVLIAGDDDQAIYEFKQSSPDFIRLLHSNDTPEFAAFPLPFCSRSTKVIVEAINDLVSAAAKNGFLKGRIDKPYRYFSNPTKDNESTENPKIIHKQLQDKQIPWFIEKEIDAIAGQLRKKFDVLVISPFSAQCQRVGIALQSKGFGAVSFKEKELEKGDYFDGLELLIKDGKSNLGWRLVCKGLLSNDEFSTIVQKTGDCSKAYKSLISSEMQKEVIRDIQTLRSVLDNSAVDSENVQLLLKRLEYTQERTNIEFLKMRFPEAQSSGSSNPGIKKIPITVTTVQSSKGLAADYVFITHFDRRFLGKEGVTNQTICNFLVALTRARKKVWLISTSNDANPLLEWIGADKIERK